jgi:hypothetical protein
MGIAHAKEICSWGAPAAEAEPYLQAQWRQHGNDFLAWWDRRPEPGGEVDVAQFYEMARTTSGVAADLLDSANEVELSSSALRVPATSADNALDAVMHVELLGGIVYFDLTDPVDLGLPDVSDCRLLGALCWQLGGAGLNVVPFAVQEGREGAFGHTLFDSTGASNADAAQVAIHPGMTIVAADGGVITPVELDAPGICGAVMRAGNRMVHLVVGALWSIERGQPGRVSRRR